MGIQARDEIQEGGYGDRRSIWRAGIQIYQRHPALGVGTGGFPAAVAPDLGMKMTAHSSLLPVAVELGPIGLALFLGSLAVGTWAVARAKGNNRALALSLATTWLVGSASLSWDTQKTTWFVFLAVTALGALSHSSHQEDTG